MTEKFSDRFSLFGAVDTKAEISQEQFSWNPGSKCYEDVANLPRGNRACWTTMIVTCLQQYVHFMLVEFGELHDTLTNGQYYTAAGRRPTNHVSEWQAEQ